MKKANKVGNDIHVSFGGSDFNMILPNIKALKTRKYNPTTKTWVLPNTPESLDFLARFGFSMDGETREIVLPPIDESWKNLPDPGPEFLYPFQQESLKFLAHHGNRGYLGLFMGAGKTIISLSFIRMRQQNYPALVVCPSSVKLGFLRDYKKFFGHEDDVVVLEGGDSLATYRDKNKIYVINYELLSRAIETIETKYKDRYGKEKTRKLNRPSRQLFAFKKTGFKAIVFDEAHKLKNVEAKIYEASRFLVEGVESLLFMSGTPLLSRPSDIWGCGDMLKPKVLGERFSFLHRYCNPKMVHIGGGRKIYTFKGSSNEPELHHLLKQNILLTYKKEEVLKDLPPVIKTVRPLEIDHKVYEKEKDCIIDEINDDRRLAMTIFEKLKQVAIKLKKAEIFSFIDDLLETDEKVLVFAVHRSMVEEIASKYKKSVMFYGGMTPKKKEEARTKFIEDPSCKILVGNIESLGVGVDGLQNSGCSNVVFCELPWNPSMIEQAIARLARNGYTGDSSVSVHFLVADNTIESEIMELLDDKQGTISAVVEGKAMNEDDILSVLMKKYMRIKKKPVDTKDKV